MSRHGHVDESMDEIDEGTKKNKKENKKKLPQYYVHTPVHTNSVLVRVLVATLHPCPCSGFSLPRRSEPRLLHFPGAARLLRCVFELRACEVLAELELWGQGCSGRQNHRTRTPNVRDLTCPSRMLLFANCNIYLNMHRRYLSRLDDVKFGLATARLRRISRCLL